VGQGSFHKEGAVIRETGRYERTSVAGEDVAAFVPYPLPPRDPSLVLDDPLRRALGEANSALARLDVAGEMVPSLGWFIYAFVRKEAVLSSQIEGTQATLVDLFASEADASEADAGADVEEICNYLGALQYARDQLERPRGLPLSMRLLSQAHRRLMRGVRGASKQPGNVRRSQNWIGGTRPGNAAFVPPPPHLLGDALSALERYIHTDDGLPPLVRIGLLHVQFETLHPYLDGNGRIGRLLITLLLEEWGLLSQPFLYLSLFFKRHRHEYYRRLDAVRRDGDWEGWLRFFIEGVGLIANEAASSARELFAIVVDDRERVLALDSATVMSLRLFELLPQHPIVTANSVMSLLGTTHPTASKAISVLEEAGVLVEATGRQRDRAYHYQRYIEELRAGTEL
jgi:Fic family protein